MALSIDQFIDQLTGSGLLSADEVSLALSSLPNDQRPQDGEQLAVELVRQKKLTKFQAEQLYVGKGKSLTLGNYVILDKLGQGGMGMVLKAWHRRMERTVALKVISPKVVKDAVALKRFQREVVAAAKLTHPNIVAAYDADEAKGTHFLVMEHVEGADLSSWVKQHGPMSVERAANCVLQAARGLAFAHEKGVIHRDIKPHNLLMDQQGTVKILDMGLARIEGSVGGGAEHADLTNSGAMMGTVDYMAPEQAMDSKHADARSDIYSLGCTLCYLLTGHATFVADTVMKRLTAHQNAPPPSLVEEASKSFLAWHGGTGASSNGSSEQLAALNAVFQRMVAKKPADRLQSMNEVVAALEQCRTAFGVGGDGATSSDVALQSFLRDITGEGSASTRAAVTGSQRTAVLPEANEATIVESQFSRDTDATLHETIAREANAPNLASKKSSRGVVIAGVLVTALLLAVGFFAMRGPSGTLHLEVGDELTQVTVGETGRVVKGTSEQDLRLPVGEYVLHIEREKLAFDTDPFELTKNETVSIKVERVGRRVRAMMDKTLLGHKEEPRGRSEAIASAGGSPPPLAIAPFDAKQARTHQEAWAKHLGTTIETTNSVGAKMSLIPPGEFLMGSSDADITLALKIAEETKLDEVAVKRIQEERPQHRVRITQPFRLAAHEVTIGQFAKFVEQTKYKTQAEEFGGNSSSVKPEEVKPENLKVTWRTPGQAVTDESPVTQVSWNDAVVFCNWLSEQEKLEPCYQRDGDSWTLLPKANGYRLPTEAEWEYACRAGTTTQYSFGDNWQEHDKYGWSKNNSGNRPHAVGSLPANPFGLYDMHGNVWEWCHDWDDGKWYEKSPSDDPFGPSRASHRVVRGGSWGTMPAYGRSSYRFNNLTPPSNRDSQRGFRPALSSVGAQPSTASVTPSTPSLVTPPPVAKRVGSVSPHALEFDGAGSRVEIPDLLMDVAQPMTIEAWAWPSMRGNNGVVAGFVGQCTLRLKGQQWRFSMRDSKSGSYGVFAVSDADMRKPSHVAGVWDGSHIRLFVNGIHHGDAVPCPDLATEKGMATFGATSDGVDPFVGRILQARFSRIARYSDNFDPPKMFTADESTIGLYHFEDGEGSTLTDSSGHQRHGKIVGAKWVRTENAALKRPPTAGTPPPSFEVLTSDDYEWSPPVDLGPNVNVGAQEMEPAVSGDGRTLIFVSFRNNQVGKSNLFVAHRESLEEPFGLSELLGPEINQADSNERFPLLSADGQTLVFATDRPGGLGKKDLWQATRSSRSEPFSKAVSLGAPVNTPEDELPGGLIDDGLTLLLFREQQGFLMSRRPHRDAPFKTLETFAFPYPSGRSLISGMAMSSDQRVLLFSKNNRLWMSIRPRSTEAFAAPTELGGSLARLNIVSPTLTADGTTLIYARYPEEGKPWTLWQTRRVRKAEVGKRGIPLAVAPFDAKQARAHQEAWAKHLGTTVETTNSVGAKMSLIPPGEFLVGSTPEQIAVGRKLGENDNLKPDDAYWSYLDSETPQRQVTLTRPFWIGTTEVTIGQFRKFVEATKYVTWAERYGFGNSTETAPSAKVKQNVNESQKGLNWRSSGETAGDEFPVGQITWDDACAFCAWLSEQEGLTPGYRNDDRRGWAVVPQANGYRLPTEAEWEYACRAGTTSQFWSGDDVTQLAQHELHADGSGYAMRPVGSKRPNPFGLLDMPGSMREWCQDWYDAKLYQQGPAVDPLGPTSGRTRIVRGGSWAGKRSYLRSAARYSTTTSNRSDVGGFRIVRVTNSTGRADE